MVKEEEQKLSVNILCEQVEVNEELVHQLFDEEYQLFHRKIVVLDDDPTGVQTIHGRFVFTDWSKESMEEGMEQKENLFFVLTNSRSFTKEETVTAHKTIFHNLWAASGNEEKETLIILRGDSTLRGHYLTELEVIKNEWERQSGKKMDGQILCPFFQEGGRYTINGIHYVKENEWLIPAGETEFAKDKTFGYQASDLGDFVEEKSEGHYLKEDCIFITLSMLRNLQFDEITNLLMKAENFAPIIVDAIDEIDLKIFSISFMRSLRKGKEFLIRSAAAFPKVMGNIKKRALLTKEDMVQTVVNKNGEHYGGIVVVGSHVKKTTMQLEALLQSPYPIVSLEFNVETCLKEGGLENETKRLIEEAEKAMKEGKTAVVYTSRRLLAPTEMGKEEMLKLSVQISNGLTNVVAGLHVPPSFIIAKGGITSSEVGTKALQVKKAFVVGQVLPGVPVWKTGKESKFPEVSYVIFPGNVGEVDGLKTVVELLMGREKQEWKQEK